MLMKLRQFKTHAIRHGFDIIIIYNTHKSKKIIRNIDSSLDLNVTYIDILFKLY